MNCFSAIGRLLRKSAAHPGAAISAVANLLLRGEWAALRERMSEREFPGYQRWLAQYDRTAALPKLNAAPRFSVILPTFRTPAGLLRACIASVQNQIYPNWELCIADDASEQPELRVYLEELARGDARIKLSLRPARGGISEASNSAVRMASGEWLAFLDHDDLLHPEALFWAAREIETYPESLLIYTDEDKINDAGQRVSPHFKPDYDPELLLTQNYLCHLLICRSDAVRSLNGFRAGFEGAQDWDLVLRLTSGTGAAGVRHIPRILYHWRETAGSTALSLVSKPGVLDRQKRVVEDFLGRDGNSIPLVGIDTLRGQVRVSWRLPSPVPVSVVVLDESLGFDTVSLIDKLKARTNYPDYEFIIGGSRLSVEGNVTYLPPSPSLWEQFMVACTHAKGQCIVLADSRAMPVEPEWLHRFTAQVMRPEISGACGMVINRRGKIVERGIFLGEKELVFPGRGLRRSSWGYMRRGSAPHRVSACSASPLAMKASLALGVNSVAADSWSGLRLKLSALIGRGGGRLIVDPAIAFEVSKPPAPVEDLIDRTTGPDLYSPNLVPDPAFGALAFPPRW